jgi:hypothetical protein
LHITPVCIVKGGVNFITSQLNLDSNFSPLHLSNGARWLWVVEENVCGGMRLKFVASINDLSMSVLVQDSRYG